MNDVLKEALYILKEKQNKNINACINEFIKNYTVSPVCKNKLNLTDRQKTAIIMVSMPPEISAQIRKEFSQEEIHEISSEIALLPDITSDIRNAVIEEFMTNSIDFEKNSCSYINRVLLDHTAGDYRIYFNPREKKIRVAMAKEWALNLVFIDGNEFLFHLISPTNKLAFSKNKMNHEYIIKFTAGFYSAVLAVFKEKLFFMVFDTRKFNTEIDLLVVYSKNDLRLYVNRELPLQDVLTGNLIKEKIVNKDEIPMSPGYNGKEVFIEKEKEAFEKEDSDIQSDLDLQYSNDTSVWFERAIFLYKEGDYDGSLKCCDKALELDPDDMTAMTRKGLIFGIQRKFEESLKCYDKVLGIDPDDEVVMLQKAAVLTNLERYDEAIFYCTRLLIKNPDNFEVQMLKGRCLFIKGRYEEAMIYFNEALSNKGEDLNLYFFESICKSRDGKKYTEKENKKYLIEEYEKYFKGMYNKYVEEKRRKLQKEHDEKIKCIAIKCGVSPEKGEKIHRICTLCGLSSDGAKILLEENDYDERKTLQNMMKPKELEDKLEYVCKRTKVSEEEALKVLEEMYYDEIEAVMNIKKKQRKNKKLKAHQNSKNTNKFLSFFKNNLKYFSNFLSYIKGKFTTKEK